MSLSEAGRSASREGAPIGSAGPGSLVAFLLVVPSVRASEESTATATFLFGERQEPALLCDGDPFIYCGSGLSLLMPRSGGSLEAIELFGSVTSLAQIPSPSTTNLRDDDGPYCVPAHSRRT
jgi:hypothetical protein